MPQSSPASRPAFFSPCTQTPASSSSGCPRIARSVSRPTFPVLHWMTRYGMARPVLRLGAVLRGRGGEVPVVPLGVLGAVAPVAVELVRGLFQDLRARLPGALEVLVHVVDVD